MYSMEPEEMMVGGAMFPQCLPRRSADSLSPSRISMKSYLGGDSKKGHTFQKDSLKIWEGPLSLFASPHSCIDIQVLRSDPQRALHCFGSQANTATGSCFVQATVSAWVGGLISCSHKSNCIIPSGSQSKHCTPHPWVAVESSLFPSS